MPRIIITEPGKTPQPYRLKTDRIATKIGRASDNDIIITTGSASTYHCKMKRIEGGFVLVDNDSTNGIKHEDTQYSIIDLVDGMTVQIGDDINMEFNLSDEEKEILAGEDFEPQQKSSFPKATAQSYAEDDDEVFLEEATAVSENSSSRPATNQSQSRLQTSSARPISTTPNKLASAKSNSGLSFLIFMVLAIVFFTGGLAIRHYQDHKTFIFSK